ncbi:uncharacterized protein MELLADRAFT_102365 [Melampsora larici-populina 98AG31]|uniref:Uncharacterized protein n=1 Tax=Melampsora larici-populina (strain 98AG31 / pathotype 3-4-7) TaxID=747676 RepID=F4R819_MELLP|nr:uncharacterized protein MELLADRAFT_102365 [Melampsora larici-populina 98AG31]EGG11417.1 hypothetical protein MELLADRAFT_102365 [Melampsora larici-populina 98AG31]
MAYPLNTQFLSLGQKLILSVVNNMNFRDLRFTVGQKIPINAAYSVGVEVKFYKKNAFQIQGNIGQNCPRFSLLSVRAVQGFPYPQKLTAKISSKGIGRAELNLDKNGQQYNFPFCVGLGEDCPMVIHDSTLETNWPKVYIIGCARPSSAWFKDLLGS